MPNPTFNNDINFSHSENSENEITLRTKIFQWVVQKGRMIIIITQIIVLASFLSRFAIDAEHKNLAKTIEENQTILKNKVELESEYRDISRQANLVENVIAEQIEWTQRLDDFNDNLSGGITLSSLTYNIELIRISGKASSASAFQNFIQSLISNPEMKRIVMESSRFNQDNRDYDFNLRIEL